MRITFRRTHSLKILFTISIILFIVIIKNKQVEKEKLPVERSITRYKIVNYKSQNDTKHILFFTEFWFYKNWELSNETILRESPELKECAFSNCVFTSDRNYLKHNHEYDALIFHGSQDFYFNISVLEHLKTRSPHQLYIVAMQE
jgi:Fucosyltransferase, N-terminal